LDTAAVKGKTQKLSPSWKGPGVVIEKLTPYLYLLPGMPVTPRADKISHGLCLFLRYLYTFTMIPFVEAFSASCEPEGDFWICHYIQDGPLFLGVSQWQLSILIKKNLIVIIHNILPPKYY
jgi:hypothetical protein